MQGPISTMKSSLPSTLAYVFPSGCSPFRTLTFVQMANDHPWFANVSVQEAAGWTWDFFETIDVAQAQALPNQPTMYIAETGWPSVTGFSLCVTDDFLKPFSEFFGCIERE
jgi:hypothetical protein